MATMTKAKAIKILREKSNECATSALAESDIGRRCFLLGKSAVLSRVEWDISENHADAVPGAYRSACRMDTADRDYIPSDVWNWMAEKAGASS